LALAEDLEGVPWDMGWSAAMAVWAEVYCHLPLLDRAGALSELLASYSDQFAVSASVVWGSID
jgi:hypothetical protein